jgi:hypothetical protein
LLSRPQADNGTTATATATATATRHSSGRKWLRLNGGILTRVLHRSGGLERSGNHKVIMALVVSAGAQGR